jgi:alkylated DNA repair protein alkB family protein 1
MDAAALHAALGRAREAAASEANCAELRALLRLLAPQRESCRGHSLAEPAPHRVPVRRACASELLEAIEGEAALALRKLPGGRCAYREAELLHHAAASSAASSALSAAAGSAGLVALGASGVLALLAHPGVYLLPGALSVPQQEGLVRASLRAYIERPNRRNIDAFSDPDASNVAWAAQHGQGAAHLQPKRGAAAAVAQAGGFASGLWQAFVGACSSSNSSSGSTSGSSSDGASGSTSGSSGSSGAARGQLAIDALTWATLGLQYDWTARAYHLRQDADYAAHAHSRAAEGGAGEDASRWRAPFPPPLHALCRDLVARLASAVQAGLREGLLHSDSHGKEWGLPLSLHAQAAIVNVYRGEAKLRLPMGGHSDNMERTMSKPVVSISLGCPAVFLVGGATKDVPPTPLLLRSGDVLVLSGASRAAFHGVPRVFEAERAAVFEGSAAGLGSSGASSSCSIGSGADDGTAELGEEARVGSPEEEAAFKRFLAGARININVRQVVDEPLDP